MRYSTLYHIQSNLFTHISYVLCCSVETLTAASVASYAQIENKVNEGTRNRTVASTNMNATSRWGRGVATLFKFELHLSVINFCQTELSQ